MGTPPEQDLRSTIAVRRLRGLASWAGILGPPFFTLAIISLTLAQHDFMRLLGWDFLHAPTLDWPSGLALGPLGYLMTAGFVLSGAMLSLWSWGLSARLRTRTGKVGSWLMMLAGFAFMGLALKTDPTIRSTPATWHGRLHDLSAILLGILLLTSLILLGFAFRGQRRWRAFAIYTWATVMLAAPALLVGGLAFYVFLLSIMVWCEVLAIHLRRTGWCFAQARKRRTE